jgi:hypothetical protein
MCDSVCLHFFFFFYLSTDEPPPKQPHEADHCSAAAGSAGQSLSCLFLLSAIFILPAHPRCGGEREQERVCGGDNQSNQGTTLLYKYPRGRMSGHKRTH